MAETKPPTGYGNKTTLTPTRSYSIPGGPYASKLGETTVKVTAEIERGSEHDRGFGSRR